MAVSLQCLAVSTVILHLLLIYGEQSVQAGITMKNHDKNLLLKMHNYFRAALPNVTHKAANMRLMSWSNEAAKVAQAWADTCAMKHDRNEDRAFGAWDIVGQNFGASSTGMEHLLYKMYEEYKLWNWKEKSCQSGKKCGHYNQIVWHDTELLGCGIADCSLSGGWKFHLFCNYVPIGNYYLENAYLAGRGCESCPETHPHCFGNLCSKTATSKSLVEGRISSDGKRECVFPFSYNEKLYHDCVPGRKPWCSEDLIYNSRWHYCKAPTKPCHFPFYFEGKRYESCIESTGGKYWCSETSAYSRDWHYCGAHEDD